MKTNFKEKCKSLGQSCINTKALFERRKNSFLIPLLVFVLSVFLMSFPAYFNSKQISSKSISEKFPGINEPLEAIFNASWDCKVENKTLVCDENMEPVLFVIGDPIQYTVLANQKGTISLDTTVVFNTPKNTDNIIVFLDNYIRIRYIQRDYVNEKIETYEIIGDYTELEGFDFKLLSQKIADNPSSLNTHIDNFLINTYKSTADTRLLTDFISAFVSFGLIVLVTSFMLKSSTLFKRRKGFNFRECIKISLTSAIPAVFVSLLLMLLLKMNFAITLGFIYLGRITYIYIKYLFSTKNNIYDELYASTGEERFKLK